MNTENDNYLKIIQVQIPFVKKIIQDETWLEGERRNSWVSQNDPIVLDKVNNVILKVGAEMRKEAIVLINQDFASKTLSAS